MKVLTQPKPKKQSHLIHKDLEGGEQTLSAQRLLQELQNSKLIVMPWGHTGSQYCAFRVMLWFMFDALISRDIRDMRELVKVIVCSDYIDAFNSTPTYLSMSTWKQ